MEIQRDTRYQKNREEPPTKIPEQNGRQKPAHENPAEIDPLANSGHEWKEVKIEKP